MAWTAWRRLTRPMAAVTAQETAEMAAATAEQDRTAAVAEMDAATAEQDRMAAVTAQETAEMAAETAEQDRMAAVTAKEIAEMDAATAEQDRMAAVTAQETAEMAAETAETARLAAVADKEAAEAALKTATDELAIANAALDDAERKAAADDAADVDEAASAKAGAVLIALGDYRAGTSGDLGCVVERCGDGGVCWLHDVDANAPDAITGYRGAILTTDIAELHVYTNIEDSVATPIETLYRSETLRGMPAIYTMSGPGDNQNILWSDAKRSDTRHSTDGTGEDAVTTFAGSVRWRGRYVLLHGGGLHGPTAPDDCCRQYCHGLGSSYPPIRTV